MMADRLPLEVSEILIHIFLNYTSFIKMFYFSIVVQIIEQILAYLKPSDRLAAATTCLSFYEASLSRLLWNDIVLVLDNSIEDVLYHIFKQTRKPIQHVRIKVNLFSLLNLYFS